MSDIDLRFLPDIPSGWKIWANEVEVAGTNHRIDAAVAFAKSKDQSLRLERELGNQHDPNALKVLGIATDRMGNSIEHFIGYVPKEIAKAMPQQFTPRLRSIWVGGYHRASAYKWAIWGILGSAWRLTILAARREVFEAAEEIGPQDAPSVRTECCHGQVDRCRFHRLPL